MAAYVVTLVDVNDPVQYQEYAKRAGPALAKHGGRFLTRGGAKTALEGVIPQGRVVIAEFASVDAAKAFYHSVDYQEARSHRLGVADFNMLVVEGV